MKFGSGAGGPPAGPEAGASRFEEVVDVLQLMRHEIVVVAELEELGVGVLQKLDGGLGPGLRVVNEGGVLSDDGEVSGIVRDAGLKNFLALAFRQCGSFSADDLGNGVGLRGEEF